MSRKNLFANLTRENVEKTIAATASANPLVGKTKAMNAVTKEVGSFSERTRRAGEIEKRLAEGQSVIDMDPASIDPSFVQDRMSGDIDGLLASMREQGQQVPILVRPHPEQPGRYQVAFGHRRLRAIQELGLQVKAIVRNLTDEELVVAQGQENNEREDLSFIEKTRFAARLKDRFPREIITAALSIDRTTLSTMLQLGEALPEELVDAIGSAPGVGRPSWRQLADLLGKASGTDILVYAQSNDVQALSSEDRFKAIVAHLKPRRLERGAPGVLATPDGTRLAQVKDGRARLDISIDKKAAPSFASFVLHQLPALFEAHQAETQLKKKG